MSEKNRIEVKIRGREYAIVATEPKEYIFKVCSYLDSKMQEIAKLNPQLSTEMTAVLTAVNLANDVFKLRESEDNLQKQVLAYAKQGSADKEKIRSLEAEIERLKKSNHRPGNGNQW